MNRKNIRDFQIKTLTLFLILFFPVMLNAKNIDIGTSGDAINILGSNLCLNSTCISSWNDTGGAWLTNGLSVYYNSGNVGIGTSAPQGALDIASTEGFRTMGPVVFGGSLYVGSGNRLLTVDNTGNVFASTITEAVGLPATSLAGQTLRSNGTGWLADSNLFNNGTTVGIGTTNPDPLFKLDVAGNIILSNGGSSILTSSSELYLNPNMGEGALVLNAANGVFFNDADLFPDAFSGNRAKIGSNTQRFSGLYTDVITDNGTNLGIGKTNPAFKLDVVGGGQFTNTVFGVTPGGTEPLALATVEYVDAVAGGGGAGSGLWGGTLDGNIWNGTAGAGNVGIGVTNPESSLHVAGRMILDDGGYNMYLGGLAGVSDDLSANYNVGIGFSSMQNNVAGDYNLAIGGNALSSNISGSMNIAIGSSALMNSTQSDNVAVGVGALGDLSSGSYNVAIGSGAGMFHQSGTLTTSNWSVFIGGETQALENGGFGEIVIGYGATGAGSQSVTIGNFSNKKIILTGNVGIGTTAPSNKLHVVGGGQFTNTVFGVTPGGTEPLALATVEYVDAVAGGGGGGSGLWGGALDGNIWNGTAGAGNVGIGTTAPTSKLQVLGSISINEGSSYMYDTVPALKLAKGTDGVFVNTYVGNYAGAGASTRQTAIGYRAGVSNTGSYQTVVGHGSGLNNTGTGQTALGYEAGDTNTANYQTAVGYRAGDTNSGVGQSAFGYNAGFSNIGAEQTALGYHAGFNNTGYQQTAIGASAGVANGGEYVALVGSSAGHSNTGDRVVGLGAYAGFENIGHNQVAIGYEAGSQNEANNQIAIGFSAGSLNAGMWQVAIGDYAGHLNTGSYQVAVGKEAGSMNTGSRVIGIGASSSDNNSGNDVVAIGFLAGQFNSTSNQFILQQANINATPLIQGNFLTGNVGIGITNPTKKLHVVGGGQFTSTAYGVTPGGTEPLALATVEYVDAVAGGGGGGTSLWGGILDGNIWNGTAGAGNVGVGLTNPAHKLDIAGSVNINGSSAYKYAGQDAFKIATKGDAFDHTSTIIGIEAGDNSVDGSTIGQTVIGNSAGALNTGGYQTAVGLYAGDGNTGDQQSALGAYAGFDNTGDRQVAIGTNAGNLNEGDSQVAVGYDAGSLNVGVSQSALGQEAGYFNTGSYQIAIGKAAGAFNTGSRVIGIGAGASEGNAGHDVIAIGNLAGQYNSSSNQFIVQQSNINSTPLIQGNFLSGNVGIGITNPNNKLHVAGGARFGGVALGVTPGGTEPLALATVEYVDGSLSGEYLPLAGGTMSGDLNMGGNDILNINKLTVVTVDPLYRIKGVNYSSFAPSVVGGVKEEYVARVKIDRLNSEGEYEKVIDFSKQQEGSDLWVWRKTVDFSEDNVEVLMTSYGKFAKMYYIIDGERIILRADNPVTVSYRLIGHRLDWKKWPTRATDQNETPGFIID